MAEEKIGTFEKVIFDTKMNKYRLIPLILRWAKELKHKQESDGKPAIDMTLLIAQAAEEITSGKIKESDIEKFPLIAAPVPTTPLIIIENKKESANKGPKEKEKQKKGKKKK